MKVFIKAKPNAHEEKVEKIDNAHFVVSVTEPPIQGKANYAIIKALAKYFNVTPSQVKIIQGHTTREKIIEVLRP